MTTPKNPVTEKDVEQVKELLQNAGINADVQSREDRYQGIVVPQMHQEKK